MPRLACLKYFLRYELSYRDGDSLHGEIDSREDGDTEQKQLQLQLQAVNLLGTVKFRPLVLVWNMGIVNGDYRK